MSLTKVSYAMIQGDPVNVLDFGAIGDGITDNTTAIQNAINTGKKAVVPFGTYKVTSSLVLTSTQQLHLANGATITKNTGTIAPVIRITGNQASLTGEGQDSIIICEDVTGNPSDPSTEGIINFGGATLSTSVNVNWSQVRNIALQGSLTRWTAYSTNSANNAIDADIAIKMVNGDNFITTGSDSCFNNLVDNVYISQIGIGVDCEPVVQLNSFSNIFFFRTTLYGFRFRGAGENSVTNMVAHQSAGITYLKIGKSLSAAEATAAGFAVYKYPDRVSRGNQFVNIMGEPGADGPAPEGRDSRVYNIDNYVQTNYIQAQVNTGHADINTSTQTGLNGNFYIGNGNIFSTNEASFYDLEATNNLAVGNAVTVGALTSTPILQSFIGGSKRQYVIEDAAVTVGQSTLFTFASQNSTSVLIEISANGRWGASNTADRYPAAKYIARIFTNSSGNSAIQGPTALFEYVYSSGTDFTFTSGAGNGAYTIALKNPITDALASSNFYFEITMLGVGHTVTSATTI